MSLSRRKSAVAYTSGEESLVEPLTGRILQRKNINELLVGPLKTLIGGPVKQKLLNIWDNAPSSKGVQMPDMGRINR